jgi:hypothetical protein
LPLSGQYLFQQGRGSHGIIQGPVTTLGGDSEMADQILQAVGGQSRKGLPAQFYRAQKGAAEGEAQVPEGLPDEMVVEAGVVGHKYRMFQAEDDFPGHFMEIGGILDHLLGDPGHTGYVWRDTHAGVDQAGPGLDNFPSIVENDADLRNFIPIRATAGRFNVHNGIFQGGSPGHNLHFNF